MLKCKMGEGGFAGAEGYDPILTMTALIVDI